MRSFFRVTGSSGRASLAGLGVIGAAGVVLLVLATLRSGEAAEAAGSAPPPNPVPGMASLSGTVTAPSPFTAARVYIRNEERGVLYQVFTQRGRYRAVALFPGEYEVSASVEGLESEI